MKNIFKSTLILIGSTLGFQSAFADTDEVSVPYSLDKVDCNSPSTISGSRTGYVTLNIQPDLLAPYTQKTYYKLRYEGYGDNNFCLKTLAPLITEATLNNGYIKGKVNIGERRVSHFVCTEHGGSYTGCKDGYYTYEMVEDIQVTFSNGLTMSARYY